MLMMVMLMMMAMSNNVHGGVGLVRNLSIIRWLLLLLSFHPYEEVLLNICSNNNVFSFTHNEEYKDDEDLFFFKSNKATSMILINLFNHARYSEWVRE